MNNEIIPANCRSCKFISKCFMDFIDAKEDVDVIYTTQVQYKKRQTLCKEGEFSSSIKLILTGYVLVLVEGPNKKNIIINILSSGDFLGVSAITGEDTYSFTAIALTDTLVCSVERESVVGLFMNNGKFALKLSKWYCSNLSMLFGKLKTIGFKNQHGRIADTLLFLDSFKFVEGDLYKFLTRKDIADFAGMPMESAVRILSEFNDSKLIEIQGKKIEVLNAEMLNKISHSG